LNIGIICLCSFNFGQILCRFGSLRHKNNQAIADLYPDPAKKPVGAGRKQPRNNSPSTRMLKNGHWQYTWADGYIVGVSF
jgi:hypothetical protein